jgi:hypothetical protein
MKRILIACAVGLGAASFAAPALAEEAPPPKSEEPKSAVGADVGAMIPVGNLGNVSGILIGGMLKFEYPAMPSLGITARTGFFYGMSKEPYPGVKASWNDVPFYVGARYYLLSPGEGLHLGAEVGLNYLMIKAGTPAIGPIPAMEVSTSEAKLGVGAGAGYKISGIDIRAGINFLSIADGADAMAVMATVGYDFAKF